ncbi:MAG: urea transporter [Candidatus Nomurabacteria bacterium]|nr:urea transporter [Candidatus Nomurabacteria bacterium]
MKNYVKIILRGVGQVMLQENAWTGLLFLIGIFYNSWIFGLGALLGNIISTLFAKYLKYSKEEIEKGLYGFNGTLVGIAIFYFFGFNFITTIAIIIGAILSTLIMHIMSKKIPAFSAPFVISTWIIIFGFVFFNLISFVVSPLMQNNFFNLFSSITTGFGQVMFQENIITGILFFIGIIINSKTSAYYALYGSLLGSLFAVLISLPLSMINIGLFGYNAVLCGIALSGKQNNKFLLITTAIILSVLLNLGLDKIGVETLTAPFVLAIWIVSFSTNFLQSQLAPQT